MAPSSTSSRPLIAILGPTASGKTAAAIHVARALASDFACVEAVSADSRQVRAGMRIGTAAPTPEERAALRHHLVEVVAPDAPWSLADFLERARAALEDTWARGGLPLLVGGTGQYAWALLEGWRIPSVPADPALRAALEAEATAGGGAALLARLATLDPASAARIDPRNVRRVIRALEIVEVTGAPVPPLERDAPSFAAHVIGLRWSRAELHERVRRRAEAMYASGLVEETRALLERYPPDLPALRTIGYAEAVRVASGEWSEARALERTITETHRLVRMQAAWFPEDDPRIEWVPGADLDAVARAARTALARLLSAPHATG